MTRVKTRYKVKQYRDGGAVQAVPLSVEIDTPKADVVADAATADMLPAIEAMTQADDASTAFQRQIDALRRSEKIQRQRAAQAVPPPLTANQTAFLEANPEIIKHPDIAVRAIFDAHQQGHEPDSIEFHQAVKSNFNDHMSRINLPELQRDEPTPKSFGPLPRSMPSRAAMYSAPVSRDVPSGASYDERHPTRVTLTPAEKEAARFAGISEVDYAQGKLELQRRKREGDFDR